MGFDAINQRLQEFSEDTMGEAFSHTALATGTTTSDLTGVFNQVEVEFRMDDFSTRQDTRLICVSSKAQWTSASATPANRDTITYGGIAYQVEKIAGTNSAGEPAYELTLKKLT